MSDELRVELIALLLLAPLIWSSSPTDVPVVNEKVVVALPLNAQPTIDASPEGYVIHPPADRRMTMVVLEHSIPNLSAGARGPASVINSKMIEVIVSAP